MIEKYIPTDLILNREISYCRNAKDTSTIGNTITIGTALTEIKSDTYKEKISRLRKMTDSSEQRIYKSSFVAYLFSGVFSKRESKSLDMYSYVCVLDIDDLEEEKYRETMSYLDKDPHVFAFWTSPRGSGLKGLIVYQFSEKPKNNEYSEIHKEAFDLLSYYFLSKYEIVLDSGKDVSRLCYTTWDPNLVLKNSVIPFSIDTEELILHLQHPPKKVEKAILVNMLKLQFVSSSEHQHLIKEEESNL